MNSVLPAFKKWFKPRAMRHRARFEGVLGTALELQLLVDNQKIALQAENVILEEIVRLERVYSFFQADSELNRWQVAGCAVPSPDLRWLLEEALHWQELSHGAFHSAIGAVMSGQGSINDLQQPLWTWQGNQVQKLTPHKLNFNALAKGRIADKAAQSALQLEGVHQVLVNLGGDLCHQGQGAGKLEVSIAHPFSKADNAPELATIWIQNQGVATSGHTHRGAHIFNPRESKAVSEIAQVTIIAPDAASADVIATICCVLEPAQSLAFTESSQIGCLLVTVAGEILTNQYFQNQQITEVKS